MSTSDQLEPMSNKELMDYAERLEMRILALEAWKFTTKPIIVAVVLYAIIGFIRLIVTNV